VRAIIQQEPTITDAEWKARTLDQLAAMEFATPKDHAMIDRAIAQVEFAVRKTLGPRPLKPLIGDPPPPPKPIPPYRFEGRTNRPPGWDLVQRLLRKMRSPHSASMSGPADPVELKLTEFQALNEFWRQVNEPNADKLALLRAFSEISIIRSTTWDPKAIRAVAAKLSAGDAVCFCCGNDRANRAIHHVIQIQYGGSNYARNRVVICELCHAAIHPWLPKPRTSAWWSFADFWNNDPVAMIERSPESRWKP
jgi:hypothetical protein